MSKKEAAARLKINRLLEEAGWYLFDEDGHKANVSVESHIKINDMGDDFEHSKNGFIDHLMHSKDGNPLAVLEAKRESIHPLSAKEQAREYANSVHARYIILSNGNTHYLWDTKEGNPEPIIRFPAQASLDEFQTYQPNPSALSNELVDETYIAKTQMPNFAQNPQYLKGGAEQLDFLITNKLKIMRPYQVDAIQAIQNAAKKRCKALSARNGDRYR